MDRKQLIEYAMTLSGASYDCPFEGDDDSVVLRHKSTGKWFGLIMNHNGEDIVNLKCEPDHADLLRSVYNGITPAYHMNKTHWNTIYLNSDVPDEEIHNMIDLSFALTGRSHKKRRKNDNYE